MRCEDFLEGLTTLAEGGSSPAARAHIDECAECAARVAQLERVVAAARWSFEKAPFDLVSRATELMRARPRLVARLLGNGLATSGARRGGASDFALHVGVDGFSLHLHYARIPEGWEVLGRAPTPGWSVAHSGGEVPCGASGRFRLVAIGLDGTAFVMRKDGTEIEVLSAREMIDDGP